MPDASEGWKSNIQHGGGWVKEYPLAPNFVFHGWVHLENGIFCACIHENEYGGLNLGSRNNLTDLEAAKRWCDLMVDSWIKTAWLTEKTIKSLWYVERN